MRDIQIRVMPAFLLRGSLNAVMPLEIASTPVNAVVPLAKACRIRNGVMPDRLCSVSISGGSITVPRVFVTNERIKPVITVVNIIATKK